MSSVKLTVLQFVHDDPSPHVPCAFLLVLLTSSLLLNASVVLAVTLSPLRSSLYNCLLAYFSGVAMLESCINVTSSVVFRASWDELYQNYGDGFVKTFCRGNATSMELASLLQCFILAVLSVDRSALLAGNGKQNQAEGGDAEEKTRVQRMLKVATPLTSLFAVVLVLPIAYGLFATRVVEQRFSCSPVYVSLTTTNTALGVVTILIGYNLPWLFIIQSWWKIAKRVLNERRRLRNLELVARQRAAERRSPVRGMASSLGFSYTAPWSQVWGHVNYLTAEGFPFYLLAGFLVVLHLVFVLPNVISVQVSQFFTSYDTVQVHASMYMKNSTHLPEDLTPLHTNVADAVFTWTRYCYIVVAPLLVLIIHKEVRSQCFSILCGCTATSGLSQARSISAYVRELKYRDVRRKHEYQKKRRNDKYKRVSDFRTPVLFATSEGLHFRTVTQPGEINLPGDDLKRTGFWNPDEPRFVCEFCDLVALVPFDHRKTRLIPRLSQTPPLARSPVEKDVRVQDEIDRKGKVVRFAQNVSEIPLTESGIYSSDDQPVVTESSLVQIKPAKGPFDTFVVSNEVSKALPNRVSFDRLQEKRFSDTFIKFPNMSDISKNLSRDRNKSLEFDLIQNGNLNESSASLLLSLSQRMRNRNS